MQLDDLQDKIAIVTGAAGGIGGATARLLAAQGATVVVADIDAGGAELTADDIRSSGGRASARAIDLSDAGSIEAAVASTVEEFGRIDLLHSNAGVNLGARDTDVVSQSIDGWDLTMAINLRGAMLLAKYAVPHLIEAGRGNVVFTSSASGSSAEPGHSSAYASSKAGVDALTRSLATQYGKHRIRVNGVAPGPTDTPGFRSQVPADQIEVYRRQLVWPDLVEPDDIARTVAFLLSDASSPITGQTIHVDGGLLIHNPIYADVFDPASVATR